MKKICFFAGVLLACSIDLFAQGNEIDAYTLSKYDLGGTARSMAMGGAFGALGGDMSVLSNNPAGLGIYRSSEVSGTFDLSIVGTNTDWSGMKTNKRSTRPGMNNFGFELYFPTSSGAFQNWNFAFSYNKLKNYQRKYTMESDQQKYSMADYIASRATNAFIDNNGNYYGIDENDLGADNAYTIAYMSGQWLPVLGYGAGMFGNMTGVASDVYHSAFGEKRPDGTYDIFSPNSSLMTVIESGSVDEYNIGLGTNISNILFLGASFTYTDLSYRLNSDYEELFHYTSTQNDHLYLQNWLNTEGIAVSANFGAIVNLQNVRLGVAYNSPRYFTMTDYYNASAGTYINGYNPPEMEDKTPNDVYSEYSFLAPGKWIFSGAIILGQTALVSADYEMTNYGKMQFSDREGHTNDYNMNSDIRADFTRGHALKLGGEVKITPQFAVRAGYMMQTSPMKAQLYNNTVEVLPSGTIPHFTVTSKPTNYYTAGLGYRFTPNFYMDMAFVYGIHKADAYAFSNTYYSEPQYGIEPVYSTPAALTTKKAQIALTLGYKF